MKTFLASFQRITALAGLTATLLAAGCASAPETAPAQGGGVAVKNPHLEKVWLADGFDFNGYDTLYIAPTLSSAKYQADEARPHELAQKGIQDELAAAIRSRNIFAKVVTSEADVKPESKTLRLENTIIEYSKGGGAARYFAGLYGAGQPVLRVVGKMSEGQKQVFTFQGRRSGVSAGARLGGAFMKDEDIQIEDIRSLVKDLTDFMEQTARKLPKKQISLTRGQSGGDRGEASAFLLGDSRS